ncbi:MAG: class I SAM-dependent methyltransferase [Nostocaceae cyanobacterium]|nr:class I SAM-dependent methyltransferase [Nostocaceae cyanobacterium]
MTDSEQTQNWYSQDLSTRKNWYRNVADAYNSVRPRYPKKIISRVVELAQFSEDTTILEIGCGPGTATVAFAELGFSMVCLEPSKEACQLARQNCTNYPDVEIVNTTFEEWDLGERKFNAVVAATSFHWIAPEIRYRKVSNTLEENGYLILLWNTPVLPNNEVYQALQPVYQTHNPSLGQYHAQERVNQEENIRKFAEDVIDSRLFKDLVSEQVKCEVTYSIDDFLTLLGTYSPYIALEPENRISLLDSLREVLQNNFPKGIAGSYFSIMQMMRKI